MTNFGQKIETDVVVNAAFKSKSPFWTGFKVYLGIALAQAVLLLILLAGCSSAAALGYYFITNK